MKVKVFASASMTAIALLHGSASAAAHQNIVVDAPAGSVRGVVEGGLHLFKGLPYAAPPVGENRWRPPVELSAWKGVHDATKAGPACIQAGSPPQFFYFEPADEQSEDCLSLNIWAPESAAGAPVFLWIHGGALINGAGSRPMFDGAEMARRGLVVVSINYRLGVLGYLAHPELSAESDDGVSGNYGLLDQIAALRWVKSNIAAFGGDPARVTIAGESAGALSVMYLMASPNARGLFHRAIAQSAYMVTTPELRERHFGLSSAEAAGRRLEEKLEVNGIKGLRFMDPQTLTMASLGGGFIPSGTIDGHILPHQLVDIFDNGEQAPVPMIAGFNSGELRGLPMLLPLPVTNSEAYEAAIRKGYGELADTFLGFYPSGNIKESMLAAARDAIYGWTSERLAAKQTTLGIPSYLYFFDHGSPEADKTGLHAFHASEIPYIFGTTEHTSPNWPKIPDTDPEQNLSRAMTDYWASFAKSGVPVAEQQPDWVQYGNSQAYMHFSDGPHLKNDLLSGHYELHEEVVNRRRAADIAWDRNVGVASPPLPPPVSGR